MYRRLTLFTDSQLVAHQVSGESEARDSRLAKSLRIVHRLMISFDSARVAHISREENQQADLLSRMASGEYPDSTDQVMLETLESPSRQPQERLKNLEQGDG